MVIKDLGKKREGWISWVQRIITVVKLFLYCSLVVKYIIPHSLKPTDYTIPGVNIIVNIYGLWMIMVHQCSFIDYNKWTTLCAMWIVEESVYYGGMGYLWTNFPYFLLIFVLNLKVFWNIKSIWETSFWMLCE